MDSHDDDDLELEDAALAAALRQRADELAGPLAREAALVDVLARARVRRRWRVAASIGTAAAAAVIGVLVVASLGRGDSEVLRSLATPPAPATTVTASVPPASSRVMPPSSSPPTTAPTSTQPVLVPPVTTAPIPGVTSGAPTAPRVDSSPAAQPTVAPIAPPPSDPAPPSTTSYSGVGGSISVRLVGGRIALDRDPIPSVGWSVRIDDDGPDRVRVRFEQGGKRTEVRVDLVNGVLEPRVTEG